MALTLLASRSLILKIKYLYAHAFAYNEVSWYRSMTGLDVSFLVPIVILFACMARNRHCIKLVAVRQLRFTLCAWTILFYPYLELANG